MIKTKLMPHQQLVVDFVQNSPVDYAGIFAGYGTGKTLIALSLIEMNRWRRVIVVSTKTSITSTWPDEIEKHSTFRYCLLTGTETFKVKTIHLALARSTSTGAFVKTTVKPIIFLVNFDGIANIFSDLVAMKPDAIFVDESTKIKSSRARRTTIAWALGQKCSYRFAMTGFPITENLAESYAQIRFLDGGQTFGKSFLRFRQTYFYPKGFKFIPKPGAAKKVFDKIKSFCIMVPETVIQLPPKVYNKVHLAPSKQQAALLDNLKTYFQLELGKVKIDTDSVFTLLAKSLQICDGFVQDKWCQKIGDDEGTVACCNPQCHRQFDKAMAKKTKCPRCGHAGNFEVLDTPKDDALLEILEELQGQKVIIWVNNRVTINKLVDKLTPLKYKILTLQGSTEDPGAVVKAFQHGPYNVLIATLKKASESITLTACKHAIYYSQNWSYDLRGNSEARIRRKGSERHGSIIYTDFYIKDTTDQLVYDCWRGKESVVKKLKRFFT